MEIIRIMGTLYTIGERVVVSYLDNYDDEIMTVTGTIEYMGEDIEEECTCFLMVTDTYGTFMISTNSVTSIMTEKEWEER